MQSLTPYITYGFWARIRSCLPAAICGGGHVLVVHANIKVNEQAAGTAQARLSRIVYKNL